AAPASAPTANPAATPPPRRQRTSTTLSDAAAFIPVWPDRMGPANDGDAAVMATAAALASASARFDLVMAISFHRMVECHLGMENAVALAAVPRRIAGMSGTEHEKGGLEPAFPEFSPSLIVRLALRVVQASVAAIHRAVVLRCWRCTTVVVAVADVGGEARAV